jgi:hypothetical protein
MKLDLLTNATVVDDAIRFVSRKSLDRINEDEKASSESDYDEDAEAEEIEEKREQQYKKTAYVKTSNQI